MVNTLIIISVTLIACLFIVLFIVIAFWLLGKVPMNKKDFIEEYKESNKKTIQPPRRITK